MQWWPLEVNSDQKIYQDYPHPRLAKKSNQGIRPYFSFTLASLNFQSKISFRTFFSLKKKIHACLSLSLFSLKRILSTARFFLFHFNLSFSSIPSRHQLLLFIPLWKRSLSGKLLLDTRISIAEKFFQQYFRLLRTRHSLCTFRTSHAGLCTSSTKAVFISLSLQ